MTTFRLLWQIHKWLGIALGAILILSAVTGLLLLLKKDFEWLQPPTHRGTQGPAEQIQPLHAVYEAVFALEIEQLRSEADIDRIDFRPERRLFKVRSKSDDIEVQVDAITLQTWGPNVRNSDWVERLHDGSLLGDWAHGWLMPIASVGLVLLTLSGYLIWLWPKLVRRRARARLAAK